LSKIEDKVTELVIRRNRQTKQDPPEANKDDMSEFAGNMPDVLKLAKDIGSKPEQEVIDNKEINSIMKKSDIVNRAIAKFSTGIEKDKLDSLKK